MGYRVTTRLNLKARLICRRWMSSNGSDEVLLKWVRQEGGQVTALEQQRSQKVGWGLTTTQAMNKGETLISLPPHLPLTIQPSDSYLLALSHRIPEELWALKLGLKLLSERGKEDSFWWPYIHNLPQRFTLPIFFSPDEIQALQYPPLIHQVKKRCRFLSQFATEDIPSVASQVLKQDQPFQNQEVDASALGWAMSAVSSRAFRLHKFGGGASLLPLVDMCNHSFTPTGRLVQHGSPTMSLPILEVVAERDLGIGESLVLDYGSLSNDILLLDYGFVIPDNPHDRVELHFDGHLLDAACFAAGVMSSSSFTQPAAWQQAVLLQLKLQGPDSSQLVTLGGPEHVDGRLLAALRVMHARDVADISTKHLQELQKWGPANALGFDNERKVLRTLVGLGLLALTNFPTTIAEDEILLDRSDLSGSLCIAIRFRMYKKKRLRDTITRLQRELHTLSTQEKSVTQ